MTTPIHRTGQLTTIAAALILSLAATVPFGTAAAPTPHHVEGELLVKFRGGPRGAAAEHARNQMRHDVKRNFDRLGWQHIRLPKDMTVEEGLAKYSKLPQVLAVEPNGFEQIDRPIPKAQPAADLAPDPAVNPTSEEQNQFMPAAVGSVPNDPRFGTQWNLRLLGMTNAWAVSTGSRDVVVAVLDSGIDYTHEDLRDNMWRNPGETGTDDQGRNKASNGIDDDGNGYIDDVYGIDAIDDDSDPMDLGDGDPAATGFFHGTACAGIIGATGNNGLGIAGVNWSVRLMAIRMSGTNGAIPSAAHLEGVEYMIKMKERGINIRASNHSYGGSFIFSQSWIDAGLSLEAAGVIPVHAAGNETWDMDPISRNPASMDLPLLIIAAATESSDSLASYSNFGRNTVDLAAPGTYPPTTQPANRYITSASGTSFAAPHIAAAVGLLAAVKPAATAWEIRAALMQSVDPTPSLTNKVATHGRLNVGRAVEVLTNDALPPIVVAVTPTSSRTRQSQLLEVWFSRPMDRASVEAALEVDPLVTGNFLWTDDSTHFQFLRTEPFVWTNHTARIRGTATSLAGLTLDGNYNRLAEGGGADDYTWTFRFAPRNDDFENAQLIASETGSVTGNTYNASWQSGEKNGRTTIKTNAFTLWYRWTPDHDGWITFETTSTTIDTVLDAYTGNELTALTWLAENDDDGLRWPSRMSFPVSAGTNYSVAVLGWHPTGPLQAIGPFTLRWYPTPPAAISSFSPSSAYPGHKVSLNGTNFTGATRVLFNGVPAVLTFSTNAAFTDLQLTATLPPDATTGPITIETPHGNITTVSNFTVLSIPRLAIRPLSSNLVEVSWPSIGGFAFQRADSLTATSAWTATTVLSTRLTNGIRFVTVTNGVPNRFFRLYRP